MNSIWNNNLKAFKFRFASLALIYDKYIKQAETNTSFWEISQAKNGTPTASESGFRLHSSYNPQREANGAIEQPEVLEKSTIVFYGFGLGYHVIELAKLHPDKKIVLIEPDPAHFFAALTVLDWTPVFNVEKLILAIGAPAESVLPLIDSSDSVNIGNTGVSDAWYFSIPTFTAHNQPYFDTVKKIIQRNIRKNDINKATLKKFGKLWVNNSVKNLSKMLELNSICDYKDQLSNSDIPFIAIGAGPSLEQTLPLMKNLKSKAFLICVETALPMLLKFGIQPDFIILTDPQYWAFRHISGLSAPESTLITEISTWPAIFRFNCKEIRLCSSQLPIGQYFEEKFGTLGNLGAGGSVASSAWNFAEFCGAKEIFLTGVDLSFPGKQTHITGSRSEQTLHSVSSRLSSVEKATAQTLYNANASYAADFTGNKVLTDTRMKMFAWWFESRLAACPNTKTYSLCPRTLKIPGIEPVSIQKLLAYPDVSEKKLNYLRPFNQSENKKAPAWSKEFEQLAEAFPTKDFLQNFPFFREYF